MEFDYLNKSGFNGVNETHHSDFQALLVSNSFYNQSLCFSVNLIMLNINIAV